MLFYSASFKDRHAFDVRGVRKHVNHAGTYTTVPCPVNKQASIPRQGGWVATDIDNAFGKLPVTPKYVVLF